MAPPGFVYQDFDRSGLQFPAYSDMPLTGSAGSLPGSSSPRPRRCARSRSPGLPGSFGYTHSRGRSPADRSTLSVPRQFAPQTAADHAWPMADRTLSADLPAYVLPEKVCLHTPVDRMSPDLPADVFAAEGCLAHAPVTAIGATARPREAGEAAASSPDTSGHADGGAQAAAGDSPLESPLPPPETTQFCGFGPRKDSEEGPFIAVPATLMGLLMLVIV